MEKFDLKLLEEIQNQFEKIKESFNESKNIGIPQLETFEEEDWD